ncbi:MAG: FG-GAP-like repeat-containing protein [Acidimicrobiia bacterium]
MTGRAWAWLGAGVAVGALIAGSLAIGAIALFGSDLPETAAPPPQFVEESESAGLVHVYDGEFEYFVGGGVAVLDCDEDGRPDLYLAGGANPTGLFRNDSTIGGALRFGQVLDSASNLTGVTGAYPLDIDDDQHADLAVLRFGEDVLLRGRGDCTFERGNETWGLDAGDDWTVGFSATWEGDAMLPTLAFGNYLAEDGQTTGTCADHYLFRPEGDRYAEPVTLTPGWCTLSLLFSDWDRSGRRDLRMTNDRHYYRNGEEQLWRVTENEPPRLYTGDDGWQPMQIWGMGIAGQDLTGDGLPEFFLTSQGDNKLQTLAAGPSQPNYVDIAFERGLTAHRPYVGDTAAPSTAWHPEFQDVNNDSLMDLFVSKGNVEAQEDYAARDPSNLLLGNPDGTFTEVAAQAGIVDFARSRGAALADFNLDGMVDLIEVTRRENVKLWRSAGWGDAMSPVAMGNWIGLRLEQPAPNVDGIGSWIEVKIGNRVVQREITVGGGHAGGQLGWAHFGVGDADSVEVRVQWPDGEKGRWLDVGTNQFMIIERGSDEAVVWDPGQ